jgi:hypothetical protein
MLTRRQLLRLASAGALATVLPKILAATKVKRVLFVHGRAQEGRDAAAIQAEWVAALKRGADATNSTVPTDLEIAFPYFGDILATLTRAAGVPLVSNITARGGSSDDEFLVFQAQVAEDVRLRAGVTDAQVDAEYGANERPRGFLNWEWVQASLRALDKYGGGMSKDALEIATRDVFLYCTRPGVRDEIDRVVVEKLTDEPTVVVSHSLGTVVAYSLLCRDTRRLQIPLLVTLGSPLGIRAVRDQFRPLRYPPVGAWYNAFDSHDVVALFALDETNFPVKPAIENNNGVKNHTDNRHGIVGYLDDAKVAKHILDKMS